MPERDGLKTTNVYLDTQVFYHLGFDFSNPRLQQLVRLAKQERLRVFSTDISVKEVRSGIRAKVSEAAGAKVPSILRVSELDAVKARVKPLDKQAVETEFNKRLDYFLIEARVKVLPVLPEYLEPVLARYFKRQPPFGSAKNKSEFPDALALEAILATVEAEDLTMAVISKDGGVATACSEDGPLFHFEDITAFLDAVASEDEVLAAFVKELPFDVKDQVLASAEPSFESLNFYLENEEGEVERVDLIDLQFVGPVQIVSLEPPSWAVIEVEAELDFIADLVYSDSSTGSYDSEDDAWFFRESVSEQVDRSITKTLTIELLLEGIDVEAVEVQGVTVNSISPIAVQTSSMDGYPWK